MTFRKYTPISNHYILFYEPGSTMDGEMNVVMDSFGPLDNAIPISVGQFISGLPVRPGNFKIISIEHTLIREEGVTKHEMHCYTVQTKVEDDLAEKLRSTQ